MTSEKEKRPQGGEGAGDEHTENYSKYGLKRCKVTDEQADEYYRQNPPFDPYEEYYRSAGKREESAEKIEADESGEERPPDSEADEPKAKRPIHEILEMAVIENYDFCLVDDMPCIRDGNAYCFGWVATERAMLQVMHGSTRAQRREACETLKLDAPENVAADPRYIAFENGVFDVERNKFVKRPPRGVITVTIPHDYDPNAAECEAVETLLDGISCGDAEIRCNLEELLGLAISRYADTRSSAVWLYGQGANGKSTFLDAMAFMVGKDNVSYLMPHELATRFDLPMMVNKLLNISDDTPANALDRNVMGNVKKIVTGNPIKTEEKGLPAFTFRPFCTMAITSNDPPSFGDTTYGTTRRFHPIPLSAKFDKSNPDCDMELAKKLRTEKAAQWMLRLAVQGLRRVLDNPGMTETRYSTQALQEAKERSNSVIAFLSTVTREEILETANVDICYRRYKRFADNNGHKAVSQQNFSTVVCRELDLATNNNGRYKDSDDQKFLLEIGKKPKSKFRKFVEPR